ncbi:MAG: hypothetical protein N3D11_03235 [Candidatus Sumerlaeia bacterium]|nr:hypothetical protein [Candidatus Sumerlaeia bacterium]
MQGERSYINAPAEMKSSHMSGNQFSDTVLPEFPRRAPGLVLLHRKNVYTC